MRAVSFCAAGAERYTEIVCARMRGAAAGEPHGSASGKYCNGKITRVTSNCSKPSGEEDTFSTHSCNLDSREVALYFGRSTLNG